MEETGNGEGEEGYAGADRKHAAADSSGDSER